MTDPSFQNAPVPVNASNRRGHFGIAGRIEGSTTHATALYTFRGADGLDYVVESRLERMLSPSGLGPGHADRNVQGDRVDPATGKDEAKSGTGFGCRFDLTNGPDRFAVTVTRPDGALYHRVGTPTSQLGVGADSQVRIRAS